MIKREIIKKLKALAAKFPVVAILGPRQSGKTTLAQYVFDNYRYVSLEEIDNRKLAQDDPRGFLKTYDSGVIIDEAQRAPDLFSYLQTHVDKHDKPGQFILTGSQHFLLAEKISQSLAGRIALLNLLPLSLSELKAANYSFNNYETAIWQGFYPGIYSKKIDVIDWYPNYLNTYVERDVREIKNISDVGQFQMFLKMCASRVGRLLNLSELGNDCGITHNTAKAWISLLEQSFIVFRLRPYYKNYGKRLVKTTKLYFYDTGLACSLLDIESVEQLTTHYSKGALFENLIITELLKNRFNQGLNSNLYFWRDKVGHEIDCVIEHASSVDLIECKSGRTINKDFFANLEYWENLAKERVKANSFLIYGGDEKQKRSNAQVLSWRNLAEIGFA